MLRSTVEWSSSTSPAVSEADRVAGPNAERALADHMTLYFHEGYGEQEINDIVSALKKVERYYLK